MFDAAHPCDSAFDAHAKAAMRDAAVATKIQIPIERILWQVMRFELFFELFERCGAFAAADDLAVTFGSEQVYAKRTFGPIRIYFEIKAFDRGREVMNKDRRAELV